MKIRIIKCDRCQRVIENYMGRLVIVIPSQDDRSLDLCDECWDFFYDSFGKGFLKPQKHSKIGYMGTSGTDMEEHDY